MCVLLHPCVVKGLLTSRAFVVVLLFCRLGKYNAGLHIEVHAFSSVKYKGAHGDIVVLAECPRTPVIKAIMSVQ